MADPVSLGLTIAAGTLGAALLWVQRPITPTLDGERWFKVALATLVRGEVERSGGTAEAFEGRVRATVPYHPAGRFPERKVSNPAAAALPGAALPGEVALVEQLARLPELPARVAHLYDHELGHAVLFEDPDALGPAHDFARVLGPRASWDALAAWPVDPAFGDALRARLGAAVIVLRGPIERGAPVLEALGRVTAVVELPWAERTDDEVGTALRAALGDPGARMVLFAEGEAVLQLLRGLVANADVRDRVAGVVSVGGVIGGLTAGSGSYAVSNAKDFLDSKFDQENLETDAVRLVPYLSVQWWDREQWPPGLPDLPLQNQRFPEPRGDDRPDIAEVVDLGPLFPSTMPSADLVARALLAVAAGLVVTRRG